MIVNFKKVKDWYKESSPILSFSNAYIFWLTIAIVIALIAKILQVTL